MTYAIRFLMCLLPVWAISAVAVAAERVTLLHTNDLHGRMLPFEAAPGSATSQTGDPGRAAAQFEGTGAIGGVAWLAQAIESERETRPDNTVVLLDAGDTFSDSYIGNATRGKAMVDAMNAIGYDMMALGNHDFDYGLERTQMLAKMAEFPMRAANVRAADGTPVLGRPWQVFERGGIRVAVLALGYQNTSETGNPDNFSTLKFGDGIAAAREYLPQLRAAADVVVVLSHQGTAVDRALARSVDGIDLIVGGHSHDRIAPAERIGDTFIVQAMADGAMLGVTELVFDEGGRLNDVESRALPVWHADFDSDPAIAELVAGYVEPHRGRMEAVLTRAVDRIGRQYKSPSAFDRIVGEAMREQTGTDVALMPGVGYGVSISPGLVTRNELYTLLPHPAKLVTIELTGAQIGSVLEQSATNLAPAQPLDEVGGLVQTAGIGYTIDFRKPIGERVYDIVIEGRSLQPNESYTVATNTGMARGLHRYAAFTKAENKTIHDMTVTDVVAQALKTRNILTAPPMNEVRLIRAVAE